MHISEDLDQDLRKQIANEYQTVRKGLISQVVEEAIRNHLAVHKTQQCTQIVGARSNQIFNVNQLMEQIKRYFINSELYVEIPDLIPEVHLDRSIANIRGSDVRTIKKWKKLLLEYGKIKRSGIKQYQITES